MIYHDFQGLKLSALGFGTMRLPVLEDLLKQSSEIAQISPLLPHCILCIRFGILPERCQFKLPYIDIYDIQLVHTSILPTL